MVEFKVSGMTCGGCVRSVMNAVKHTDPHAKVDVDLGTKVVSIASTAAAGDLAKAISDAGYVVEPRAA